ncbi:MAG TPA: cell envelope biogenesis protein TolA [Rhizomicrobium sp.]|jgi:colicin import membrane protein|nr:cell envelope biogenesis protein TolA [Rhizomicrobium sp.]
MPRALKTYVTSLGFFELAVAAPSMKAALEAWGAERNLFHQGFARETDDPAIVAATMARPGVILKRAVGSGGTFREQAELPTSLPAEKPKRAPKPQPAKRVKVTKHKVPAKVFSLAEARAAKQAAAAFERAQARREADAQKEEAARTRERARRDAASAKAEADLEKARQRHDEIIQALEGEREALDRRVAAEEARWKTDKQKLEEKLRRARA